MDGFIVLVGVLGIDPLFMPVFVLPMIGRVPDLNDVERVNIKLFPLPLIMLLFNNATRRFGGGDGGGNGALERSALPYD
jgi:hypothetical protein